MAKRNKLLILSIIFALLLFGCVAQQSQFPTSKQIEPPQSYQAQDLGLLKVHYIDVGQADSILIQGPAEQTILIDGGNNNDGPLVVEYLKRQNVKRLDAVIATHPHEDHIGGLDVIIKAFPVASVYMPNKAATTKTFSDLIAAIENSGAKKIEAKLGVKLEIPGLDAVFVAPIGKDFDNLNNFSAVLKLTHVKNKFLFTGDAESESEQQMLLQSQVQLSADVLKVGHHGSGSSTSSQFLKAVNPKYAVISVGKGNDYGHPHSETLNKLAVSGISLFRTDQAGTVIATSDGETVKLKKSFTN